MATFIALLQAIPAIVNLFQEMARFLKQAFGDDPAKFLNDSSEAFKRLNDAKSTDDRINALKDLQGLLNRVGSH